MRADRDAAGADGQHQAPRARDSCTSTAAIRAASTTTGSTGAQLARADAPASISQMDLAAVLADPGRSRALVCWNINPVASSPDQAALRAALAREDLLTVVCDLFLTDTAAYADYVLPAASFLESDDIVASYFHHTLSAQVKAVEPPGHALRNAEIFRRLAAGMGYDEQALQEGDGALIEQLLAPSGVSWDELARAGTVRLYPEPRVQFADGFPTPSGRIELASARAEADGHPRLPEPSVDEPPPPGYLRLLSPASPWLMNATFGNDRKLRRRIGAGERGAAPARGRRPRPAQGRSGHAAQRDRRAAAGGRDQRCRAAGRGVRARRAAGRRTSPRARTSTRSTRAPRRTWARARPCTACSSSSSPGSIGRCAPAAASSNRSACRPATCTRCRTRPSASPTARATASRSRAARGRAASRRCSRRPSASTCACTAPRRAPACSCSPTPSWPRWRRWRTRRRSRSASSRGPTPPGTPRRWRAARRAGRSPPPRAARSRSCRASPTRAARRLPACAAC